MFCKVPHILLVSLFRLKDLLVFAMLPQDADQYEPGCPRTESHMLQHMGKGSLIDNVSLPMLHEYKPVPANAFLLVMIT